MADCQYLLGHESRVGSEKDFEVETNIWSISFVWMFREKSVLPKECLQSSSSVDLYSNPQRNKTLHWWLCNNVYFTFKICITAPEKETKPKYFHENSFLFSSLVVSVPIDRGKREAEIHKVIYYPLNINGCYRNCGLRSYKVKCLCRALTKDG